MHAWTGIVNYEVKKNKKKRMHIPQLQFTARETENKKTENKKTETCVSYWDRLRGRNSFVCLPDRVWIKQRTLKTASVTT